MGQSPSHSDIAKNDPEYEKQTIVNMKHMSYHMATLAETLEQEENEEVSPDFRGVTRFFLKQVAVFQPLRAW